MKKKDDLKEMEVLNIGLFAATICSSIPPNDRERIEEKANVILGHSGTERGTWNLPCINDLPDLQPIECNDYENRWHYMLLC